MINNKSILAIIPARGGSKRLPRKNILDLAGKPLVAWTIESALMSEYIDRVIVSTDDLEIADVSKQYGADIPFIRPNKYATDTSSSLDVIEHSVEALGALGEHYEYVVLLQPTSPLRTWVHIDDAFVLFMEKNADSIISVCETGHPSAWVNTIPKTQSMFNFFSENKYKRSQDYEIEYRTNGAIYISAIETLFEELTFFSKNSYAYIMKRSISIDIDDEYDLKLCQLCMSNHK